MNTVTIKEAEKLHVACDDAIEEKEHIHLLRAIYGEHHKYAAIMMVVGVASLWVSLLITVLVHYVF